MRTSEKLALAAVLVLAVVMLAPPLMSAHAANNYDATPVQEVGAVSPTYGEVLVGVAATAVPTTANTGRSQIFIQNMGPNYLWCGFDSSVTSANGVRIDANGGTYSNQLRPKTTLYCITSAVQVTGAGTRYQEN
jgi:hypothetical protein